VSVKSPALHGIRQNLAGGTAYSIFVSFIIYYRDVEKGLKLLRSFLKSDGDA